MWSYGCTINEMKKKKKKLKEAKCSLGGMKHQERWLEWRREEKIRKKEQFKKCKCRGTPRAVFAPPPPLCGAWILRRGSLYQKHHSWMRRRPLRKISCHPFLKIFVNLVSSVCGFISTCINVSSLVTEPQYLGEDIIKNVWGVGGGRGGLLRSGSARKRRGGGGRVVWEEEGEVFLSSCSFPWEPVEHRASDNRQTGWAAPLFLSLSCSFPGITLVSVCCYLFNDASSTDLASDGKLVSLLTATWHRGKQQPNAPIYWYYGLITNLMHNEPIQRGSHMGVMAAGKDEQRDIQWVHDVNGYHFGERNRELIKKSDIHND